MDFFTVESPQETPIVIRNSLCFIMSTVLEGASWGLAGVLLINLILAVCKISRISNLFVMLEQNKTLKSHK